MSDLRFCRDCRWREEWLDCALEASKSWVRCWHPKGRVAGQFNVVTGAPIPEYAYMLYQARSDAALCGPAGNWFEAGPSPNLGVFQPISSEPDAPASGADHITIADRDKRA